MKDRNGFTMVELVIVVAVLGILAAVVIPALVRARVAANEAATIGDIRTVISAQTAYRSANGGYYDDFLACLNAPAFCIPSYPLSAPTFLDSALASLVLKSGYNRSFDGGDPPVLVPAACSGTSVGVYRYDAVPEVAGVTGSRGFAGGSDDRVCFTPDGSFVPAGPRPGTLPVDCAELR